MMKSNRRAHLATIAKPVRPTVEALEDRLTPTCHIISGFVYQDANNNGIFDAGELPIANSPIQLRNAAGQVVGSTTTNAQGYYEFDHDSTISVAPTSLTKVVAFQNTETDFSLTGLLDRFDADLGELQSIEITHQGSITSEIQVENFSPMSGSSISGTVGGHLTLTAPGVNHDLTLTENAGAVNLPIFDGAIDFAGASGASFGSRTAQNSATITLTGNNLAAYIGTGQIAIQESATATSSAAGGGNLIAQITSSGAATITVVYKYIPSNCLDDGNYTIVQTSQPAGLLDGIDSKGGVPLANSVGTDAIAVTLAGADLTNNNFGEIPPPQLSGFVYHDANNNGVKDANEEGIAGVTITLTGADDLGQVNKTATTNSAGAYQFLNLRPGTYHVAETQPSAYLDGKDTAGSTGGTVTNDLISAISLPPGAASVGNNFGELKAATVAGFVYVDANNNGVKDPNEQGIAGVVINLSGFTADGPVSKQATTNAAGAYSFTNLVPGTYGVQETQPGSYLDGKDSVGSQGGTLGADQISGMVLASGTSGQNNNFGELNPARLAGFVYADANNNGVKDGGEAPIAGATITLSGTDDLGAVSKTATTDASGLYHFTNLRPGSYQLSETQPSGYLDGKDAIGTQGGFAGNDQLTNIALAQGTNGEHNNFGELPAAELSGFVYIDSSKNGVKDADESGISGVTITLTGNNDVGAVNTTAVTNANGAYKFANLRPGTYTLTETHPSQYEDGQDAIGSQGGTTGNDVLSNIALGAGVIGVNNNFGEITPEIADLSIVKTTSAPVVKVGDLLTYTLTVTNLGQFAAKDVVVTDDLPIDAAFISATGSGWSINQSGGVVTAARATLAVNQPAQIFVTIRVPAVSNTLLNHTHVSSSTPDPNPLNNSSSVTTPVVTDPLPVLPLATRAGQVTITSKKQLI
ncbi:MAG: carboxypeptidase regulatory-like domain-containing protein, partial [Gemmataceae bacterium]|nr:carboxypeptidase regulatory-like domain-containing protein [Gemmataceae bacterium]